MILLHKSAKIVGYGTVVSTLNLLLIIWLVSFLLNQNIVWRASQITRSHKIACVHRFGIWIGPSWLTCPIVNIKFPIYLVVSVSLSNNLVRSIVFVWMSLQVRSRSNGLGFLRVFASMLAGSPSFNWFSPFKLLAELKPVNCDVSTEQACVRRSCHKDLNGGDIILIRLTNII